MFWKRIYPYNIHICTFVYNIYGYIYIYSIHPFLRTSIFPQDPRDRAAGTCKFPRRRCSVNRVGEMMRFVTKTHGGWPRMKGFFLFQWYVWYIFVCWFFCWHLCLLSYMCSCSFICCSFLFSDFAVFSCMVICFYMYWYILCFVATAEIHMLYQLETRNWVTRFDMIGIDWCRKAVYATNI